MERLTERANDEFDGIYVKDHDYITASHKLADYEDGEENGLLARLPYKVGNDVWSSEPFKDDKMRHGNITIVMIDENGFYGFWCAFDNESISAEFIADDIGKTVFLTPEEAEQALKKTAEPNPAE